MATFVSVLLSLVLPVWPSSCCALLTALTVHTLKAQIPAKGRISTSRAFTNWKAVKYLLRRARQY